MPFPAIWPNVPLTNQWTALVGATVHDADMYSRIDGEMNTYASWLLGYGSGNNGSGGGHFPWGVMSSFTRFYMNLALLSVTAFTGIGAAANVVDQSGGGVWDDINKWYVVPGPGLYLVSAQIKWSSAINSTLVISGLTGYGSGGTGAPGWVSSGGCTPIGGIGGHRIGPVPVIFQGGEHVQIQENASGTIDGTPAPQVRSYFQIDQIGY